MVLTAGTRFGPYEIAEAIGAGGMGEVYRAHDTTLERDVAIKVLPTSFADDVGRVERFEREAKTLAALNHPNIAQIYGLEKSDGTTALVMELVDGSTLGERITKGPLPADEALGIAMQIADALEAAHGQHIVHRDLKPANIKLKHDGTVKVLDFGIAKALAPENLTSGPQSPIMTTPATQVGVILGTAAYMSPEQAKGKAVDQRTDIWAFGCVLYEMLTGQLAFGAEDLPTTLARVIDREISLDSVPATVSPAVRHTIKLCLQKDPRRRLHSIGDVRLGLEGALEPTLSQTAAATVATRPLWRRATSIVGATAMTAIVVGFAVWQVTRPEPARVSRFAYVLPENQFLRETPRRMIAISSDGRHFAYNTTDGLYLRELEQLEARLIVGTETSSVSPAFSPDGQSVVYGSSTASAMQRMSVSGGAAVTIANARFVPNGVSWAEDDTILVGGPDGVYRMPANGGSLERIIDTEADGPASDPRLLPDGNSILFSVATGPTSDQIVSQSLSTGERTLLVNGGSDARYVPTGHLIYVLGNVLFGVPFDLETSRVTGGAVPLVQGVRGVEALGAGSTNYDVSNDGTLIYLQASASPGGRTLVWVDRDGREDAIENVPPRAYTSPRLSPDGTKLALNARDEYTDIYTWDFARRTLTRFSFNETLDRFPAWSPDGQWLVYTASPGSSDVLVRRPANGGGAEERIAESDTHFSQLFATSFLAGSAGIVVYGDAGGHDDIGLVRQGDDHATPLLATTYNESAPDLSPDGRWLAYVSDESGREEVYVRQFPDVEAGGLWQVSTDGGREPLWARSGGELFYHNGDTLMAVPVETSPTFTPGNPVALFRGNYFPPQGGRSYDVTPEGERFLMIKPLEETGTASPQVIVVQNWFEELKRLVPAE